MRIFRKTQGLGHARKTVTFTGAAGLGAAGTAVPVFTITGRVFLEFMTVFCTTGLTEAAPTATVSMGCTDDVDAFIAVTNSVDIDTNEWWNVGASGAPTAGACSLSRNNSTGQSILATNKLCATNIIINPLAQNTNGGVLVIDAFYRPITDNGLLT